MEQLLHFLNELPTQQYSNTLPTVNYTDSENRELADYLMGKTSFEKVEHLFKGPRRWIDETKLARGLRAILAENVNTPEIKLFLTAVRCICSVHCYASFIEIIVACKLSAQDVYVKNGLVDLFLIDVINVMAHDYHRIQPNVLGYKNYTDFFGNMYKEYPSAFEKLAGDKEIFFMVYLYGKDPGKYKKIGRLIKTFETGGVKQFYLAYSLLSTRDSLLDSISGNLIETYGDIAFGHYRSACSIIMCEAEFLDVILPLYQQNLLPKVSFLSYVSNYKSARSEDSKTISKLFFKNEKLALEAAKKSSSPGGINIMNVFWKQGQHIDKLNYYEEKCIKAIVDYYKEQKLNNIDSFEDYIRGITDKQPVETLPYLYSAQFYLEIALLAAVSLVPVRYMLYLISNKQYNSIEHIVNIIYNNSDDIMVTQFFNKLGLPTVDIVNVYANICVASYSNEDISRYKQQALNAAGGDYTVLEAAIKTASAKSKALILEMIYTTRPEYNPNLLVECLGDSSKVVRELAVMYLTPKREMKEQIEPLLQAKKKAMRECAEKLMIAYNAEGRIGYASGGSSESQFNTAAYCTANIPKTAAKTIAWTEFDSLPKVRVAGSGEYADDSIIRGYIYLIVSQTDMILPPAAAKIRETLNKDDLRALGQQLYHIWKNDGAVAKRRGVLIIAGIDGDDAFVNTLKADIQNWADTSRHALASEAVRAMALQGGNFALMTVDAMSKKFNNKQVKRVAEEAFGFAAEQLGVDPEVLGDRIVPTLGFDNRGEQVIDYGNRQFTAVINSELQITLKNDGGKVIKSLPAPGANDDMEKATKAKAEFAAMKKTLKSIAGIQCLRLEQALSCNRTWVNEEWSKLFVENPIMNMFAIGLIWGTYDETGNLISSFRYMEDGSFTDVEENNVDLDDGCAIGLCHPLDLGEGLTNSWIEQLHDYEIKQPVEQLSRKVYCLEGNKNDAYAITDFNGALVYAVSLLGKLQKLGWHKGSIQDGGGYDTFYKEDKKQKIGVQLKFSGTYVGADSSEEVTVYNAAFYNAGTVEYGSYIYDEIKPEDMIALSKVPKRLYSEICYDIERATAKRIEAD